MSELPHRFTPNQIKRLKREAATEDGGTAHVTALNDIAQREGYATWDRLVAAAVIQPATALAAAVRKAATAPPTAPGTVEASQSRSTIVTIGDDSVGPRQVILLVDDASQDPTLVSDIIARITRSPAKSRAFSTKAETSAVSIQQPAVGIQQPTLGYEPMCWKDLRVMVIDDSSTITRAAEIYLAGTRDQPTGIVARGVQNSEIAMGEIRRVRPHLVFLDLKMPVVEGWAILQEIKADPELNGTDVIILSSHDDGENRARAFAAGAVDFISKPFARDRLLRAVSNYAPKALKAV